MVALCITVWSFGTCLEAKAKKGTKNNPYSAYSWHKVNVYNMWGEYTGTVKIKMIDCKYGDDATSYLNSLSGENSEEWEEPGEWNPGKNKQYIYMKFKIKCIKSDGEFWCGNIVDEIYNKKSNKRLNAAVVLEDAPDGTENIANSGLYQGGETTCVSIHVVKKGKGNTPVTFTVPTGYEKWSWFTTKNK